MPWDCAADADVELADARADCELLAADDAEPEAFPPHPAIVNAIARAIADIAMAFIFLMIVLSPRFFPVVFGHVVEELLNTWPIIRHIRHNRHETCSIKGLKRKKVCLQQGQSEAKKKQANLLKKAS
jgi:hypothetical protein